MIMEFDVAKRRLTLAGRWLLRTNSDHFGCVEEKYPKDGKEKKRKGGRGGMTISTETGTWGSDMPCLIWPRWETRLLLDSVWLVERIFKSSKVTQFIPRYSYSFRINSI